MVVDNTQGEGVGVGGVKAAAGVSPRVDLLGRTTLVFPGVGEMRVAPTPGCRELRTAIRVFINAEVGSAQSPLVPEHVCQIWHGVLDAEDAGTVAGSLAVINDDRARYTMIGDRIAELLGRLPDALASRRTLRRLRRLVRVARWARRTKQTMDLDPFGRYALSAGLRTQPDVIRGPRHAIVQFDRLRVEITERADGTCRMAVNGDPADLEGAPHGIVPREVAPALLHAIDADTRLSRAGRGPDLMARVVLPALEAGRRDPNYIRWEVAETVSPGLWDRFADPRIGSHPAPAAAIVDAAVDLAVTPGPAGEIRALLAAVLGPPEFVPVTNARLFGGRRGWVELHSVVDGIGLATLGVNKGHGEIALNGPRAVALAAALALLNARRDVHDADLSRAADLALVRLRAFAAGDEDIADAFEDLTEPWATTPLDEVHGTDAFMRRWEEVRGWLSFGDLYR